MVRLGYPDHYDGQTFLRASIAKAMGTSGGTGAIQYARTRWGTDSDVVEVLRTAVPGGEFEAGNWGTSLATAGAEFLELVKAGSILGRLQGLRQVPANTPYVSVATGPLAYWRGQSKAYPCSTLGLDPGTLAPLSLGALIVVSNTLLQTADPKVETLLRDALVKALTAASDASFIDENNAGQANIEPAAITYNVSAISSTGDLAADVALMLENFDGDLATSAFVMSPSIAAQIVLATNSLGLGAELGLRGGSLLGLPAIVSSSSEHTSSGGSLVLVDASRVVVVDEGVSIKKSDVATVEMATNPAGASDTPTSMANSMVSLYQCDATALLATRRISWVAADGAVTVISNIAYGTA